MTRTVLAAAIAAVAIGLHDAAADPILSDEQTLADVDLLQDGGENALNVAADVSTQIGETIDLDWTAGDFNLQDSQSILTLSSDDAHTSLGQLLSGQSFSSEPGAGAGSQIHNTVHAEISAPGGVAGTVGLNAAAGAFNVQKNASAIAVIPGSMLALSVAGLGQEAASNTSLHHSAINDISAVITLENVTGDVGINLASGVGNVQLNSFTTALSF